MKNTTRFIFAKGKLLAFSLFILANANAGNTPPVLTHMVFSRLSLVNPTDTTLVDGALALYDPSYNNGVDYDDAIKMVNGSENVSYQRNGVLLAIERRKCISCNDTLFLNVTGYRVHQYRWNFSLSNMDSAGRTAFLVDNYTGITTPLNLNGDNLILFDVTGAPGSSAANRFTMIFKQPASGPLAVQFTSVSAVRNTDKTVTVKWNTENEINMQSYTVQHSDDGISFTDIGTALPLTIGSGAYSFIDTRAGAGNNYYRIKANSLNGQAQYTAIVKTGMAILSGPALSIYPNPVTGGNVNLHMENMPKGAYRVDIINKLGQPVHSEIVQATNDNFVRMISLGSKAAPGVYVISVSNDSGTRMSVDFIAQ